MITKIVSGGQTGADRGGLLAGWDLALETGGWAPRGWQTESGPAEVPLRRLGLVEHPEPGYPARTLANVRDSTATVIFGRISEPGSGLTLRLCGQVARPCLYIPLDDAAVESHSAQVFDDWVREHRVRVLNVAGNRESVNPGLADRVRRFLREAWVRQAAEADLLRALTIRQPWAEMILTGEKKHEYRTWRQPEELRGVPILLHAGRGEEGVPSRPGAPEKALVGWVRFGQEEEIEGREGLAWPVLARRRLPCPVPCPGQLRHWRVDPGVVLRGFEEYADADEGPCPRGAGG